MDTFVVLMPQLTIDLPDDLFERLVSHASLLGRTPEALAAEWIRSKVPSGQTNLFGVAPAPRTAPPRPAAPPPLRTGSVAPVAREERTVAPPNTWMLWADGACSGNPGPGGWGIVVQSPDGTEREESQGYRNTTNNRMEMRGAIEAISMVPPGGSAIMHTDSRYVVDAIQKKWIDGWKKRGWRKADGGEVKNVDLWELMSEAMAGKKIQFQWVEGHAGNRNNERCDRLAVAAAKGPDLIAD